VGGRRPRCHFHSQRMSNVLAIASLLHRTNLRFSSVALSHIIFRAQVHLLQFSEERRSEDGSDR